MNKEDIKAKVYCSGTILGQWVWAVDHEGSGQSKIYWADNNRDWNPWPDGWVIFPLPSLFPPGKGKERELAVECLKSFCLNPREIERIGETDGVINYAEEYYGDWMEEAKRSMVEHLTEKFLREVENG